LLHRHGCCCAFYPSEQHPVFDGPAFTRSSSPT